MESTKRYSEMTPKEKAIELWEKYFRLNYDWDGVTKDQWAKEGALIAVNELVDQWILIDTYLGDGQGLLHPNLKYWQEVKQEIEKL
jgi:hypothetical protein